MKINNWKAWTEYRLKGKQYYLVAVAKFPKKLYKLSHFVLPESQSQSQSQITITKAIDLRLLRRFA